MIQKICILMILALGLSACDNAKQQVENVVVQPMQQKKRMEDDIQKSVEQNQKKFEETQKALNEQ